MHTNLGRSRLAEAAVERVVEVARDYSNLEYDLERGDRGRRHDHVEALLTRLTGAEAAMVVNNNAAAVLLLLSALAEGREVIVSRGQLVEIGGSFRIPDIMRLGGARLVEVGTTNKTRSRTTRRPSGPRPALLLRVHTSNFKMLGFTEEAGSGGTGPSWAARGASGCRRPGQRRPGRPAPPSGASRPWRHRCRRGPTWSASAGTSCWADRRRASCWAGADHRQLRKHPLARAVRVDKMTLAALEGTLLLYQEPERAAPRYPCCAT